MTPGSPEWNKLVTASKVAAILGVSPWESPRSVWHRMHGDLPASEGNESTRRGQYLEPAILAWWRDQHPEVLGVLDLQPTFTLDDWAAATPDAVAINPDKPERVLVEAKSAAFDDDWGTPGTDEIPTYYLVQVQWQMHVSGIHRCYVPIITSRLRFVEYVVDYVPEYGAALEARMREFYDSLAADEPPELDDTVATFDAVRKVHPEIERGESVELTTEQADDLVTFAHLAKETERSLRLAKSTVIDAMGRAQYAEHNGVRVARRQPRGDDVTFVVVAKPTDLNTVTEESA